MLSMLGRREAPLATSGGVYRGRQAAIDVQLLQGKTRHPVLAQGSTD
jgi:hypothetical protein